MFVNFSNHPNNLWGEEQFKAAACYGEVRDVPFPSVEPEATEQDIQKIADEYCSRIKTLHPDYVLCQGEFCLVFAVTERLKRAGITVGAACSKRVVTERNNADGTMEKTSLFQFVKFRRY